MKRIILTIVIIIVTIYTIVAGTDYTLSRLNKRPLFAFETTSLTDGGSTIYQGLGYKVTKWEPFEGQNYTEFKFFWVK